MILIPVEADALFKSLLDSKLVVNSKHLLLDSLQNHHRRVLLLGTAAVLIYLARWIWLFTEFTLSGATFPVLVGTALYLGLQKLWQQRSQISTFQSTPTYRRFSDVLILFGTALFFVSWQRFWLQALAATTILIGIALGTWGLRFFRAYWSPLILILSSVYPGFYPTMTGALWQAITPPYALEKFMASAGAAGLKLFRYPATSDGINIHFPDQVVEVFWPCAGFDLVLTIIGISVLAGIMFQLHWLQTFVLSIIGSIVSLILNVIRIALMTLAAVYWGDQAFEFWHGPWGGQIFALVLFTLYYYLCVWVLSLHPLVGTEEKSC